MHAYAPSCGDKTTRGGSHKQKRLIWKTPKETSIQLKRKNKRPHPYADGLDLGLTSGRLLLGLLVVDFLQLAQLLLRAKEKRKKKKKRRRRRNAWLGEKKGRGFFCWLIATDLLRLFSRPKISTLVFITSFFTWFSERVLKSCKKERKKERILKKKRWHIGDLPHIHRSMAERRQSPTHTS